MAEHFKSITDVRKVLPELSQTVQRGVDRYVITNQGKPQSVLMGYGEYQGLMAATELLNRPGAFASLERGLEQKTQLSFEDVKESLRRRKEAKTQYSTTAAATNSEHPMVASGLVRLKMDEMHALLEQIAMRLEGLPIAAPSSTESFPEQAVVRKWGGKFAPMKDRILVPRINERSGSRPRIVLPDAAKAKQDHGQVSVGSPAHGLESGQEASRSAAKKIPGKSAK